MGMVTTGMVTTGMVTMAPVSLQQQVKAGDPKAIAEIINCALQPKGITAKALLQAGVLKVTLQSKTFPAKAKLAPLLEKSLLSLLPQSIQTVSLFCLHWGSSRPLWSHTFQRIPHTSLDFEEFKDPANIDEVQDSQLRAFLSDLDEATLLATGRALGLGPALEWSERSQLKALIVMKIHQLLTLATTELTQQPEGRLSQILLASRLIQLSQDSADVLIHAVISSEDGSLAPMNAR